MLLVVPAQERSDYETDFGPVIGEAYDLLQPLGGVWTAGLPAYQGMGHDHRYFFHDGGYVSNDDVHTNQTKCFWSLLQTLLAKFCGPSNQLEQAARTCGSLRPLNIAGVPIYGLIDCVAVTGFC